MAGTMDDATRKRVRAGRMRLANKPVAEVAGAVGVGWQTAYMWKARLDEDGIDALSTMARGRPSLLGDAQREQLCRALLQRPHRAWL